MKSWKFTLIELLIVIAIIGILMGILLPVLGTVKTKGKEVKSRTDINSIVAACKQYESDYGVLPSPWSTAGDLDGNSNSLMPADATTYSNANSNTPASYKTLMQLLTGVTYFSSTTGAYNVRNIRYLEVPTSYSVSSGKSFAGYVDPWGWTYGVCMNLSYDGSIDLPSGPFPSASKTLNIPVAIWSRGSTGSTYSSSESTNKYICSWK